MKGKMNCPKCKKEPTGKYRDEEKIDGMYCKRCGVAWNIDWETQQPDTQVFRIWGWDKNINLKLKQ